MAGKVLTRRRTPKQACGLQSWVAFVGALAAVARVVLSRLGLGALVNAASGAASLSGECKGTMLAMSSDLWSATRRCVAQLNADIALYFAV